jgi:hypothetical protein
MAQGRRAHHRPGRVACCAGSRRRTPRRELLNGAADREIGLTADGGRYCLCLHRKRSQRRRTVVTPDAVIVVSGGGRGVTAATVIALAQSARPRIALLGRTVVGRRAGRTAHNRRRRWAEEGAVGRGAGERQAPDPARTGRRGRSHPRRARNPCDAGSAARRRFRSHLSPCDVTDPVGDRGGAGRRSAPAWGRSPASSTAPACWPTSAWPRRPSDDFQRVFGAKIGGLRSLLAATADDPLNVICLFSSVAARTGNAGQADYAMANEVLNRVAHELAHTRPAAAS